MDVADRVEKALNGVVKLYASVPEFTDRKRGQLCGNSDIRNIRPHRCAGNFGRLSAPFRRLQREQDYPFIKSRFSHNKFTVCKAYENKRGNTGDNQRPLRDIR